MLRWRIVDGERGCPLQTRNSPSIPDLAVCRRVSGRSKAFANGDSNARSSTATISSGANSNVKARGRDGQHAGSREERGSAHPRHQPPLQVRHVRGKHVRLISITMLGSSWSTHRLVVPGPTSVVQGRGRRDPCRTMKPWPRPRHPVWPAASADVRLPRTDGVVFMCRWSPARCEKHRSCPSGSATPWRRVPNALSSGACRTRAPALTARRKWSSIPLRRVTTRHCVACPSARGLR